MKRIHWIAICLVAGVPGLASAASLSGSGQTSNANDDPEEQFLFEAAPELDPAFADDVLEPIFCIVACPGDSSGAWQGSAAFGRLATRTSAFSQLAADLSVGSSLSVAFDDSLTVTGLASGLLLLDYEVEGFLTDAGASLGFFLLSVDGEAVQDSRFSTADGVPMTDAPEGSFEFVGDRWRYTESGTVGIPFGAEPIAVSAALRAIASCEPPCTVTTDLVRGRVGNARIFDGGAGEIDAESGYDYATPVPEPASGAWVAATALALAAARRRRRGGPAGLVRSRDTPADRPRGRLRRCASAPPSLPHS